jgi:hypothetical protein
MVVMRKNIFLQYSRLAVSSPHKGRAERGYYIFKVAPSQFSTVNNPSLQARSGGREMIGQSAVQIFRIPIFCRK